MLLLLLRLLLLPKTFARRNRTRDARIRAMGLQGTTAITPTRVRIIAHLVPDKLEFRDQLPSLRCRAGIGVHGGDEGLYVGLFRGGARQTRIRVPGVPLVLLAALVLVVVARGPRLDVRDVAFHCLLVEAVEAQALGYGGFLRARADLVDGVEGVAEDAVCGWGF